MSSTAGADASFEIEDFLLKKGANVNKRDNHGRVPLHYAFLKTGNQNTPIDPIETVSSLCAVRGTVTAVFSPFLTLAIVANNAHHGELCLFFCLDAPDLEIDVADNHKRTPLHYAAQRGATTCSLLLLNRKAGLENQDEDGIPPCTHFLLFYFSC
jgi:ankyrin repeat protein